MSAIREEVVKLTKFKGGDEMYEDDRQEYLAALLIAIDKLSNQQYDLLSDGAADWHVDAVKAKDNDEEIPDFPDTENGDGDEAEPAEGETDNEPDTGESEEGDEEAGDTEGDNESEPVAAEPEPPAKANRAAKPKAAKKEGKKPKKQHPPVNYKNTRDYANLTGEKDKFGVMLGTKAHEAVMMYEQGVTADKLMHTIGGRHYNILKKMVQFGHKVEKLEGGVWKLTHKGDVPLKKGKK